MIDQESVEKRRGVLPPAGSRARLGLAIGGVAVVAAGGLLVGMMFGGSSEPAPDPVESPAAASPERATVDYSVPTSTPDVQWQKVDLDLSTVWIPTKTGYGPANSTPGRWSGWSQSPLGALMAGWTIQQASGVADPTDLHNYWRQQAISSDSVRSKAIDLRPTDVPHVTTEPRGFEVLDYTGSEAKLRFSEHSTWGNETWDGDTTVTVRWQDGDWRLMMTEGNRPQGQDLSPEAVLIPWGP